MYFGFHHLRFLEHFLRRCDLYEKKLIDKDKHMFMAHLTFKLVGRASFIYEAKPITDWDTLRRDFVSMIVNTKSLSLMHYQLEGLRQQYGQTLRHFIRNVHDKLHELTITTLHSHNDVRIRKSFEKQHERMALGFSRKVFYLT